ncbi:MAG: hypothetical protein HYZ37_00360 [Candidatus Solibacter usitatus]|nr:hypothetical protein [Candidatus Solibacter usitatus]
MFLVLALLAPTFGADVRITRVDGTVRGAALHHGQLYLWGSGIWKDKRLRGGDFGAGGCAYDVDGDRRADLILQTGGKLVWLKGPSFRAAFTIDTEADFSDCLGTTLLGRRGVLVAHRGMQVRFYQIPPDSAKPWPYREIYSFYTASYQSGLVLSDIDGDGLPDIVCGNYWIQSPKEFELPWRLFAINTYNEHPHSAHVRLAMLQGQRIVVSQGFAPQPVLALFSPPLDRKQLWTERRIDIAPSLQRPNALLTLDGNDIVVGENVTGGRLLRLIGNGGKFSVETLTTGDAVQAVFADGPSRVYCVREHSVEMVRLPQ